MTSTSPAARAPARREALARAADAFKAGVKAWRAEYALAMHASAMAALPRRHVGAIRTLYVLAHVEDAKK